MVKLNLLKLKEDTFLRKNLIELFNQNSNKKIIYIEGDAGSGKTTFLSMLFDKTTNYSFLTVSKLEKNKNVFLKSLINSLYKEKTKKFKIPQKELLNFIISFLNSIEKDFYLIIDDFHEISEDNEIVSLIKILMKNTNENIHLILSSRFKLQEEFYIDLLRERVFIISNELLKLTRDEIVYFFKFRNILIDKKDAEEIYKKSDGWIIYINLISKFYNKKSEIYDLKIIDKFFEDEIFSLLNDNEREILKIFTLKEVVPKNVVESFYDDGLKILKNLSNKNIFIEEEDNYFKIHPVFKEVVLNKFGKLDKNSSLKLARIYEKYRYYKDAFEIYILFKEYEDGVRIIEIWGLKLFESNDIYILEDLINSIPKRYYSEKIYLLLSDMEKIKGNYKKALEIVLKIDPTKLNKKEDRFLKFIKGELLYLNGEYKKAFKILNSFSFNNEYEIKRVQILAIIYHFLNNDNKFKKYMEKALILSQKKGDLYSETKILNDLVVGWYEPKGEIVESEIMLKKALSITNKNNLFLNPVITGNLAYIKEILGEYKEAEKIGSNALKIARKIGDKSKIIFILRILGSIYIKLNEFDKAKRVLEEALILTEDCPDPSRKIGILYNLSSLYESLNQYDKATLFAKEDLELTKKIGNEKFISQSYLNLGKIYLRAKEYEKSKNFLSMAKDIFEKFGYKLNLFETYLFLFLNPTLESSEKEKIKDKIFSILEEKDYSFYYKSILKKEELDFINQNIFKKKEKRFIVKTFGEFVLIRDRSEVNDDEWKRESSKDLFKYLIIKKGRALKDELYEDIFSNLSLKTQNNSLRVAISNLKRVLEQDLKRYEASKYLKIDKDLVYLNFSDFDIDLFEFENISQMAIEEKNLELILKAINIYKDRFLNEDRYKDFAIYKTYQLEEIYIDLLNLSSDLLFSLNKKEEALKNIKKSLEIDPFQDEILKKFFQFLIKSKKKVYAKKLYNEFKEKYKKNWNINISKIINLDKIL